MKTLLNFYNSTNPMVILDDEKYYIYTNSDDSLKNKWRTEYIDDINILMDAIKNVKPIDYSELVKFDSKTKEKYWQTYFNYMYNNGGLIQWTNPTSCWNDELCRRGELNCEVCGNKMIMYYKPQCYICNKPKKEGKHLYLIPVCTYISIKHGLEPSTIWNKIHDYNCEGYDFQGNDSFIDYDLDQDFEDKELEQYLKWIDEEYPLNENVFYISW